VPPPPPPTPPAPFARDAAEMGNAAIADAVVMEGVGPDGPGLNTVPILNDDADAVEDDVGNACVCVCV